MFNDYLFLIIILIINFLNWSLSCFYFLFLNLWLIIINNVVTVSNLFILKLMIDNLLYNLCSLIYFIRYPSILSFLRCSVLSNLKYYIQIGVLIIYILLSILLCWLCLSYWIPINFCRLTRFIFGIYFDF